MAVSNTHQGLKAAITKMLCTSRQRYRVHVMRTGLASPGRTERRIASTRLATAFTQNDAAAAHKRWREVADQVRSQVPTLAALIDEAEADVLADLDFPATHRVKLHSSAPAPGAWKPSPRRAMIPPSACRP